MLCLSEVTWGSGAQITAKEGADIPIKCKPAESNRPSTIWFRVRDNAGMEFIASFGINGETKKLSTSTTVQWDSSKIGSDTLILKSFKREDSGLYSCAVNKGNSLVFGETTRLVAGELYPDLIRSPQEAFSSSFKYI